MTTAKKLIAQICEGRVDAARDLIYDLIKQNPGIEYHDLVRLVQAQTAEYNGDIFFVVRELVRSGVVSREGHNFPRPSLIKPEDFLTVVK